MQEDINITLARFHHEIDVTKRKLLLLTRVGIFVIVIMPAIIAFELSGSLIDIMAIRFILFAVVIVAMGSVWFKIYKELQSELNFLSNELKRIRRS